MRQDAVQPTNGFAEYLVSSGFINETALERAQRAQAETQDTLDRVVQHLGLISEGDLFAAIAKFLRLDTATLSDIPTEPILVSELSPAFLFTNRVIPLRNQDDEIVVASADPFSSTAADAITFAIGKRVRTTVMTPSTFDKAFAALYPDITSKAPIDDELSVADDGSDDDIQRLRDMASEAPIIRLVNQTLEAASERHASDIHIEPEGDEVHIRLRIDGMLHHHLSVSRALQHALSSRIKILAKLNIAEHRLPQDGRIKVSIRGREVDLRVSCLPTQFGESIVLRILDRHDVELSYSSLGFSTGMVEQIRGLLSRPNGIVLVTGPTGSGKTTTLYTGLTELKDVTRKIVSVEDPVEYELAGVSQVQVRPKIGLTFANVLRSTLRQDPDVIMIGEIRDFETAQIAMQASLTGHLVLSTLHTNSAASTITRLLDMGVEHYLVSSTVSAVVAQRLVRRLCMHCAASKTISGQTAQALGVPAHLISGDSIALREPTGCSRCRSTGYSGRIVVAELLVLNDALRELISRGASEGELAHAAQKNGMIPIYDAGMTLALSGTTTIAEVLRASHVS